ncbi:TetR/AcrR family transcriptional regulator [Sphingomonas tabacisoli]|uniref:TetR/AcrR family transcriptional regulator n=1 Tax=Sphingomonas tabacisoli TaxID=2249466 RepID=A0ABW4I7U2_9SPHN
MSKAAGVETVHIPARSGPAKPKPTTTRRVSHNLNGQRLGKKGRDTRDRILAATVAVLQSEEDSGVSLSEVARRASLGMTSIYSYFADLTELLLAVLEPVAAEAEASYLKMLREPWPDEELGERSAMFVSAFHDFWQRHTRILHLRNTMSDRQDARMMAHRVRSAQPVIRNIIRQMGHDPKVVKTSAAGMATVLYTGIERMIAVVTDRTLAKVVPGEFAPDVAHFLEAEARLLELGIREYRRSAQR